MTYSLNGKVQRSDYITLVNSYNDFWSVGSGNQGYGQTALTSPGTNALVAPEEWNSLIDSMVNAAAHQDSTSNMTSITGPEQDDTIAYIAGITNNIAKLKSYKLNAVSQGAISSTSTSTTAAWSNSATFTHIINFASGDAARYFFNCGGQIKLTFSHTNNTSGANKLFYDLAGGCGTIVLSAPINTVVATIASTEYNGVERIGGTGTVDTLATEKGYYNLSTTNTRLFRQYATAAGSIAGGQYLNSYIEVNAKTNGSQGSHGDVGNQITITTTWDEVPNGLVVAAGASTTTVTVVQPETSYISKSWGTISVSSSVTQS